MSEEFWEQREQVERFAARKPDLRLQRLVSEYSDPSSVRALDVGCAGGRNTVFLAARGFEIWALDSSRAMVAETRSRLARILGEEEARRRVRPGAMDRLDWARTAFFDLVVALGVFHCAASREQWRRSLSESARVLKNGGRCLVSVFTPETDLTGHGLRRISGEDSLYTGLPGERPSYLVDAVTLDSEMSRVGLLPVLPTEIVTRAMDIGQRVTANALFVKQG